MDGVMEIARTWDPRATVFLHHGDTTDFLRQLPDASAQLVITSPPYNIGKDDSQDNHNADSMRWLASIARR